MSDSLPPTSGSVSYGNSIKKKGQEKNIQKVVIGEVGERKKPLGRRFVELFGGDDAKSSRAVPDSGYRCSCHKESIV